MLILGNCLVFEDLGEDCWKGVVNEKVLRWELI